MANPSTIDVIIPVFNHWEFLDKNLEALGKQTDKNFKVILVDNNSPGPIGEIVKSTISHYSELHIIIIRENNQGVSAARNRGIKESKAHICAFIDADAYAHEDWIFQIRKSFAENPGIQAVGGPLFPVFKSPKPNWFKEEYEIYQLSENQKYYPPGHSPFGSNMALKKALFEKSGFFNENFGFIGNKLITGEEPELFERIRATNPDFKILYNPCMIVYHWITERKTKISYRLKRSFISGKAAGKIQKLYKTITQEETITSSIFIKALFSSLFDFRKYHHPQQYIYENLKKISYFTGKWMGKKGIL